MKGIILAGGTGTRLYPLTKVTNKHLLPIGNFPMIYYPISALKEAGINEILIVTGTEHMGDMVNLLGSGKEFNLSFTYKVQDQAGGIAEALGLAENFIHGERMLVLLGDNLFEDNLKQYVDKFENSEKEALILLKEVQNPERFGVPEIGPNNQIIKIIEKPKQPPNNLAVTGLYFYSSDVFDFIKTLKPSARGELEITDVNNWYIERGTLAYGTLKGFWTDAGTFESIKSAQNLTSKLNERINAILNR
jgi:glucose-1-phosphate thymidylyltransferase